MLPDKTYKNKIDVDKKASKESQKVKNRKNDKYLKSALDTYRYIYDEVDIDDNNIDVNEIEYMIELD